MRHDRTDDDLPLFSWSPPSAEILPWPSARREDQVARNAALFAGYKDPEKHIAKFVDRRRALHQARGIRADRIERDLTSLETALRVYVERSLAARGGAA